MSKFALLPEYQWFAWIASWKKSLKTAGIFINQFDPLPNEK